MADLRLKVATPERVLYDDAVAQVSLPTPQGEITILPNHIPLVSVVSPGELQIVVNGKTTPFAISQGVVEISHNVITVLADTAERVEEIDERRAEEAKARAQEIMAQRTGDQEYATAAAALERHLVRLRLAKKYRHHGHRGPTADGTR
jgi:F-type H+-transporting ATPase subunit epsilon